MAERYRIIFLDVKASQAPLAEGETFREARKVTVEGEAPGPYAANLQAWKWLAVQEAPRTVFPGEYVIYSAAVPIAPVAAQDASLGPPLWAP